MTPSCVVALCSVEHISTSSTSSDDLRGPYMLPHHILIHSFSHRLGTLFPCPSFNYSHNGFDAKLSLSFLDNLRPLFFRTPRCRYGKYSILVPLATRILAYPTARSSSFGKPRPIRLIGCATCSPSTTFTELPPPLFDFSQRQGSAMLSSLLPSLAPTEE